MADEIKNCGDLDERLAPFVDGEDAPAERAATAAHLTACPPCRQHADDEREARDVIHAHRAALCAPAPGALRDRCLAASALAGSPTQSASRSASLLRRWAPLSVAATLVLAVAGVFLFGLNNRVEALAASLTADHVKCFAVGKTDVPTDAVVAAAGWQRDHGWSVEIPAAAVSQELELVGVRHCLSTDGRAAHMLYRWRGEPLSLYVLPANTGREQVVRKMGHEAVIWCANQRTYAVVADAHSTQDLTRLVTYLKDHTK